MTATDIFNKSLSGPLGCLSSRSFGLCGSIKVVLDQVYKSRDILAVGDIVHVARPAFPRRSCVLETMHVKTEGWADDVQEDVLRSVEKRNLKPNDKR
mmetsp:Transcript_16442/g.22948  ORF Transcript_16442/g.22948 Transcript_16442/m.22948 type:complete len:97 (+) Transcript_16442:138-428(+)